MAKVYDPILCMMVEEKVSTKDASRGHEIVVKTQNYLNSIGKNNSVGKYDRIVHGVKSLLEQGFLEGPELERAIKQEADRLLKKYSLDECPESVKDSLADLHGAIPVGKGYVKVRGYDFAVYNAKGELKGTYASPDEAEKAARNLDECPESMTCDVIQFKPNVKYWSDAHHRYLLFKGYNDATKKYHFEDFGDDKFYFTEEEAKRLKVKDSVSSIDEAIRMCDKATKHCDIDN